MSNDIGGVWRTVGGRRIFIKDGEDLKTAMKNSGKFGNLKNKKEEELEKLQKEYDSIQNMFDPRKAELRDKINALKENKKLDDYKKEQKDKEIKQKADYLKEKEQRLKEENEATKKENEKKYKNIKVKEINQEDLEKPKPGYTRLYRGLEQEFDKNYDRSSIDNPNGYESWTDNPALAKAYGKNVYYMDVPTKDIGKNVMDNEGNRYMTYVHDKKVGIKGESGKEYMMYTDHDKYLKSTYTKINEGVKKDYSKLTRKEMATMLVDDQIKRGIIKPESRERQIQARLTGQFKMSEMDLRDYIKKYFK
jgi:hypothetical protein